MRLVEPRFGVSDRRACVGNAGSCAPPRRPWIRRWARDSGRMRTRPASPHWRGRFCPDSSSPGVPSDTSRRRWFARRPAVLVAGISLFHRGDCDCTARLLNRWFRASTITFCVGTDGCEGSGDLDHRAVAWPGGAVISWLSAHALLQVVRSGHVISAARASARTAWSP